MELNLKPQTGFPVGRWADGTPANLAWPAPHILVAGTTGSGKSGWTNTIIGALANQPIIMYGVDLKAGLELAPWQPRFTSIAETPTEATDVLADLRHTVNQRNNLLKANNQTCWQPCHGPHILLVIDELAELGTLPADLLIQAIQSDPTDSTTSKVVRRAKDELAWRQSLLASLARISRAAGVTIIAATQYPLAAIVGSDLRSNITGRISCRQTSPEGIDITLGNNWRQTIKPTDINPNQPGVAHLLNIAGTTQPRRARAFHTTTQTNHQRATQTAHLADLNGQPTSARNGKPA